MKVDACTLWSGREGSEISFGGSATISITNSKISGSRQSVSVPEECTLEWTDNTDAEPVDQLDEPADGFARLKDTGR